ncbi:hypothetical protein IFM89_035751 [Coptis chinensis]|uniref:ABC transporter domain-containing protein n=1 Tax=Coptis chinensis TaxID=261450 RepID=A0A835HB80_9MAGN|nr:hypothetical protein IFM89_035751 [Coptis chinensis]
MAAADDFERSSSSTTSRRTKSLGSASFQEVWTASPDIFSKSSASQQDIDDEQELIWAAIEKLPTYDRIRKGILTQVNDNGTVHHEEIDVTKLGMQDKKHLMDSILKVVEEDNERLLQSLRSRTDRVGISIPKIEVRFEHLSIEGDVYVGNRAIPTLYNSTLNAIEMVLGLMRLSPSRKRINKILRNVSGVLLPSRMTLLLGPPGSGKTTLLQALAGKPDKDLRASSSHEQVTGNITYCGHEFHEFVPQRTCAYISQHDLQYGEMTVRETLDFSGRCLGVGTRYDLMTELSRREKKIGIKPDPDVDAFMKATAVEGQKTSLVTDYVLKILGLEICADIMVGDEMRRGISGGQKKRVTTGEMLVGPAKALFMDEISTGLDSSTTFQIVKFMRQMVHIMDVTMIISLLQPAPETFELFDDVILLSEGQIVYQGPCQNVLEFFEFMGFRCPERKGVADFLQEVTSKKDQEQYWFDKNRRYKYVSGDGFVKSFQDFHIGQQLSMDLKTPYDKSGVHPAALVTEKYGISRWELFKACFAREWLLTKCNSFIYIFKTVQITIMSLICMTVFLRTEMKAGQIQDGGKYFGALFFSLINVMFNGLAELSLTIFKLPVFYKQRDFLFYPPWAFALPIWVLKNPLSLMESGIWVILTYYTVGFAPSASSFDAFADLFRFFRQFLAFVSINQTALALFRFIAALGRTLVVANTLGTFTLLLVFLFGGFMISKDDLGPWMIWGYYVSPMMYGQNAIAINEFLDERWSTPIVDPVTREPTVGKALLRSRGLFVEEYWYWICIAALTGFSLLFNICFVMALTYLNPLGGSKSAILDEDAEDTKNSSSREDYRSVSAMASSTFEGIDMAVRKAPDIIVEQSIRKGMVLPFQPLSLAFNHVNYYVDMPALKLHTPRGYTRKAPSLRKVKVMPELESHIAVISRGGFSWHSIGSAGHHREEDTPASCSLMAPSPTDISQFRNVSKPCVGKDKTAASQITNANYLFHQEMSSQGIDETRLQLLRDVSGAFRPGILTALVGVSGAGKTTLMDVLAGRKTGGYIEGSISISGYPKNQETFARVSGYCEQNDIHSPHVTVYESLVYSAWLRLGSEVNKETQKMFVDEVMELVELNPIRDALVGLPGIDGLSTEQRKRITIAVELVANPSIIFMDEPTSGLDARAAAIVMRTIRNTVDTGRTVVCTIHQPSIDIFESFDELLLMKRGGQIIYTGPLGRHSHKLIEYFEAIPGITEIKDGCNPGTWMLEVSAASIEIQLDVDFAEVYVNSTLYQRNQELIEELSTPASGSKELYFPTEFSQSFSAQCVACFWKQHWSYWRNPQYNAIRFIMAIVIGTMFGVIYWNKGEKASKQQDLSNLLGAMYGCIFFLGATNATTVQPVVAIERTVFYRERAAGMYSPLAYAFAQVAIEMVYVAIQSFIYSLLLFSMIGFEWKMDKFVWFFYYIFMCFVYFALYGMMTVALTPGHQVAAILATFFFNFWNLFSGFIIPRMQIPIWWRWYYWGSPISWTLYGLVTSQIGDKNNQVEIPGTTFRPTVKEYLKENLGYEHDFLGYVALAHIAFVFLFLFVFAFGIKFLNFQRR